MSAKMWEVVVEHARTCVIDQKLQFYGTSQDNGVVFDMVGQLTGIISNGQYLRADELSEAEKACCFFPFVFNTNAHSYFQFRLTSGCISSLFQAEAHESVISAFADRDKIVSFDEGSSPKFPTPSSVSVAQSSSNLPSETSFNENEPYLQHNAASPTYMESVYSLEGLSTFDDCLHQVEDNLICNADTLNRALCADELQYFETDQAIHSPLLELSEDIQGDISAYMPYSGVPTGKSERGWNILVFVLRWWFSIRRIVARKTRT